MVNGIFLYLLQPTEGSFVFKTAMLRPEPSNTPQACGVCLLNVDSRSKAFDRLEDSHKLSYGGRQYHATCANLWVNMVDSILPALPLNTLLWYGIKLYGWKWGIIYFDFWFFFFFFTSVTILRYCTFKCSVHFHIISQYFL